MDVKCNYPIDIRKKQNISCQSHLPKSSPSFSSGNTQIESLGRNLQQTVEEWACFYGSLSDVTLQSTRVRCALQHQKAPLLSVKQAKIYSDTLQVSDSKDHDAASTFALRRYEIECLQFITMIAALTQILALKGRWTKINKTQRFY